MDITRRRRSTGCLLLAKPTWFDVGFNGRNQELSRHRANGPKSTRMAQLGHRPARHVAVAKSISAPIKVLA